MCEANTTDESSNQGAMLQLKFSQSALLSIECSEHGPYPHRMSDSVATPRPLQLGAKGAYIVRLLMVGDSACGKTSLVLRFDQNVFSTKFVTTIGVDYRDKMVKVRSRV